MTSTCSAVMSLLRGIGVLAVFLSAALMEGCVSSHVMRLGLQDHGRQVDLAVGQTVEVSLESNPTTGYRWEIAGNEGSVLLAEGPPRFEPGGVRGGPLAGAGGAEIFRFKAARSGEGTVVLAYRRPWEKGIAPIRIFSIRVKIK